MISKTEWRAYNDSVKALVDRAASDVESAVLKWCRANPEATVAEKREAAKLVMDSLVQGYDDLAAEFAAEWYDDQAGKAGGRLKEAVTSTVYEPGKVEEVARYQAKKLIAGGDEAFAKCCGEYARNDALRSLNETIIANAGRDRRAGVRFARVSTGAETCAFCLMLCSRGAVYHTRETAGTFRHFHRNCDCKVVPGFESDPMAELVEGQDPKAIYDRLKEVEKSSGAKPGSRDFAREIELRDPDWLRGGELSVDYKGWSAREKRKLATQEEREHRTLAFNGFKFYPIPTDRAAPANIDLWLSGDFWELKSVTGDVRRVAQRIDEAVSKWDRLHEAELASESTPKIIVDNANGKSSDPLVAEEIRKKMEDYAEKGFDEAMLIRRDGKIVHIKSEVQPGNHRPGGPH